MSDNLVLDLLRAIRADIAKLSERQDDSGQRLLRIEMSIAGLRRDQALDAEAYAAMETRFDRMRERVERIERRLDMVETP
jgi:hypothetical protein